LRIRNDDRVRVADCGEGIRVKAVVLGVRYKDDISLRKLCIIGKIESGSVENVMGLEDKEKTRIAYRHNGKNFT
jgi:hypothetical protein